MENLLRPVLFLDLKTIGKAANFNDLNPIYQALWLKREKLSEDDLDLASISYLKKAALIPEFNTIITMSLGYFKFEADSCQFRIKTLNGASEYELLKKFNSIYNQFDRRTKNWYLLAYNGYNFHYPLLYKKHLICDIRVPQGLSLLNRKPWSLKHKDFSEYWPSWNKRGTSLTLLGYSFGILPDDTILGNEKLHEIYYQGNQKLIQMQSYNNLVLLAKLFLKVHELNLTLDEDLILQRN